MLYVISRCFDVYSDKCFKKFYLWEKRGVTLAELGPSIRLTLYFNEAELEPLVRLTQFRHSFS